MKKTHVVRHDIKLHIQPEKSYLIASDTLHLENPRKTITLYLGKNFNIKTVKQNQTTLS